MNLFQKVIWMHTKWNTVRLVVTGHEMTSWDETELDDMVVWYEWKIIHG